MMIPAMLLLGLDAPDPAPLLDAVKSCDADAMHDLMRAEPHRRSAFAAAYYAEQRAIGEDRARLLARPVGEPTAAGQATTAQALGQIEARQKQLEDTRVSETSWRDLVTELRADYLANCSTRKRNADDK